MISDQKTIEEFIAQKLGSRTVQQLIENWRIEPEKVFHILVRHFRDMGIFAVEPTQDPMMTKNLIHHLKHSPEIMVEIDRAQAEELRKKRSRHAE